MPDEEKKKESRRERNETSGRSNGDRSYNRGGNSRPRAITKFGANKERMKYILLNTTKDKIIRIESLPLLKPISKNSVDRRDPKKFCNFHKDIGHTTKECI